VIFVDTGAWFAATVPSDPDHVVAAQFLKANRELLITSDYVLDELMTLFKVREEFQRAIVVGREILEGNACRLEWVLEEDVQQAWITFQSYRDKGWSFTDCVSHSMISRLGIKTAFAFDEHFRQFGNCAVLP
jgi:predicted nucleic acid-binding protein